MQGLSPTRREVLVGTAALVIAVSLPQRGRAEVGVQSATVNAFVSIGADSIVTIQCKHLEMGQGVMTGLAAMVAEELNAEWSQMRAVHSPADNEVYANLAYGSVQATGSSTSISNSYEQMRRAGATARELLIAAAAREWETSESGIYTHQGRVIDWDSGRSAAFGELVQTASQLTPPEDVTLKSPDEFTLIGTHLPRLDAADKSTGRTVFGMDVYPDGAQVVTVVHPPRFGSTVVSINDSAALAVPGVTKVARFDHGVAIFASDTYAALQGRDLVRVEWDHAQAEIRSSAELYSQWSAAAKRPGVVVEERGDADEALRSAQTVIEAEYRFPFLAHVPIEPIDGVIQWDESGGTVWLATQMPALDRDVMAGELGLDPSTLTMKTLYAGGAFGRRSQPGQNVARELGRIARVGGPGTYKIMWTRENETKGGYYRPLTVHNIKAGLDADGEIVGWDNVIANQSFFTGTMFEDWSIQNGIDHTAIEGSDKLPYVWPHHRVSWQRMYSGVPTLWWRAVGHTHAGYVTETFLEELLYRAGKDPVSGRLALLSEGKDRDRAVLERVAAMADWNGPRTANGRALGVALHKSYGTYMAMIADVSDDNGMPKVHRVWAAIDCGIVLTPDNVVAQIEGGVGFGISSLLSEEITLGEGGEVEQSSYVDYPILTIDQMPHVEVETIASAEPPTGVGEPGVAPILPAVANAWFHLTGEMVRTLPFSSRGRS